MLLQVLRKASIRLLPNTSGAKTAEEALFAARLAHAALSTHWIKLEIHPDIQYLLPGPIETLKAAERLVKEGVVVLPYYGTAPVLCRRRAEAGIGAPSQVLETLEIGADAVLVNTTIAVAQDPVAMAPPSGSH